MISAFLLLLPFAYLKDVQQRPWARKVLAIFCFLFAVAAVVGLFFTTPSADQIYVSVFVVASIVLTGFSWLFNRTDCLRVQNLKVYYFKGFLRGWFSTAGVIVSAWLIY